jgi:hypothetical protein
LCALLRSFFQVFLIPKFHDGFTVGSDFWLCAFAPLSAVMLDEVRLAFQTVDRRDPDRRICCKGFNCLLGEGSSVDWVVHIIHFRCVILCAY